MNTAERAARRYYRKVRSWLPGGKMRRYVMTQIRETVQEFVQEHSRRGRCGDSGTAGNATGDRGSVCGKYGNCSGSEGPSHPEACAVRGLRHNAGHSDFLDGSGHC